jgi:DNA-binding NarL/FixJ family response regulator
LSIGALIVDDQADIRLLVRMIIERAGLRVTGEAASGHEALACLEETNPEVVVVDEMMPGLSGIETAALILRRRPDQRIILCTAYLDEEISRRVEAAGIHFCISKDRIAHIPRAIRAIVNGDEE